MGTRHTKSARSLLRMRTSSLARSHAPVACPVMLPASTSIYSSRSSVNRMYPDSERTGYSTAPLDRFHTIIAPALKPTDTY
ncbi:hypothetical protein BDQ12DRAFT_384590 [Crucibulum laeve]|uniref:Uncharacterized protein n=1 Tax=Crucibulum laeve TaxID=68775 RepID=A0A5C3LLG8_9AGAR|nr:hypothetical protein BDQ12DRAFT_384590 [Crucibulum laeve]